MLRGGFSQDPSGCCVGSGREGLPSEDATARMLRAWTPRQRQKGQQEVYGLWIYLKEGAVGFANGSDTGCEGTRRARDAGTPV